MKKLLFLLVLMTLSSCIMESMCYQCTLRVVNLNTEEWDTLAVFDACNTTTEDIRNIMVDVEADSLLYEMRCK